MKFKKIIIAFLVLASIGAFVGYKMYNKPHLNVANEQADITLTANKIIADFSIDEITANKNYLEKIIAVTGTVSSIKTVKSKGIITLETNDDFGSIICHLTADETKKLNTVKEAQEITIKGICTGFLMDVILVKSVITKS
ncbi:OB-fold protein [Polaribacter sp.]|uniref:OB-fold protein n=1 Tax=Polaribacter sp. TaxID=1920175 RepID=UPI003F6B4B39